MKTDTTTCNCLHGEPIIDAQGNCGCVATITATSAPIQTASQRGITNVFTAAANTSTTDMPFNLITWVKGHPIITAGLAAIIIWFVYSKLNKRNVQY